MPPRLPDWLVTAGLFAAAVIASFAAWSYLNVNGVWLLLMSLTAAAGVFCGLRGVKTWRLYPLLSAGLAFAVIYWLMVVIHSAFDSSYARDFAGEDSAWMPFGFIVMAIPGAAVMVCATLLTQWVRKRISK